MDRSIALLLLAVAFILGAFLIPRLTRESPNTQHQFSSSTLTDTLAVRDRHYSLINEQKYLAFIYEDFKGAKPKFSHEYVDDSLFIFATSRTKYNLGLFDGFFYNNKNITRLKKLNNFPANIISDAKNYGFKVKIEAQDSTNYLLMPYDFIMGPMQKKNKTG